MKIYQKFSQVCFLWKLIRCYLAIQHAPKLKIYYTWNHTPEIECLSALLFTTKGKGKMPSNSSDDTHRFPFFLFRGIRSDSTAFMSDFQSFSCISESFNVSEFPSVNWYSFFVISIRCIFLPRFTAQAHNRRQLSSFLHFYLPCSLTGSHLPAMSISLEADQTVLLIKYLENVEIRKRWNLTTNVSSLSLWTLASEAGIITAVLGKSVV